ncbi:MAG: energy-coupled thiamine transporter ThiT [Lachnospiraceae bacterium]|nr:energy-coupled thiamine transporter ThiT [Lachnospiraceae bacterium]MDY5000725.1 energy-coupled thiamine transporter ThiT [Lachnospiraceae bacterium]
MSLFSEFVNDWDELTYVPTTLGKVVLALIIVALIAVALVFARKNAVKDSSDKNPTMKLTIKQLAFCAMCLALATVLSEIKIFDMPTGGSITLLSMFVIALPGILFGLVPGIVTAVAYGILQLIIDPYVLYPMQLVVDYILAFGALGLSGLFYGKKGAVIKGYIAAVIGRYIFSVISGWIFFGAYAWEGWNPLPYSLAYNAAYIFAEAALTVIILAIPPVNKAVWQVIKLANE